MGREMLPRFSSRWTVKGEGKWKKNKKKTITETDESSEEVLRIPSSWLVAHGKGDVFTHPRSSFREFFTIQHFTRFSPEEGNAPVILCG